MAIKIYKPVVGTAGAVARNTTVYSAGVDLSGTTNTKIGLLLASTAGSITVTQQCSMDGTTFYDAVNAAGDAQGAVAATVTVTTGRYVEYTPTLAPYIRFKVVEGNTAATVVTLTVAVLENE